MINILIVDDSEGKIAQIIELIHIYPEIEDKYIDICRNVIAAKKTLINKQYDLIVLDLLLPIREGDLPRPDSGKQLLEEIHSRTCYKKPNCIVGLTEYQELMDDASGLFEDNFWSLIVYAKSNFSWSDRLARKISYLIETKKCIDTANNYDYDLGIITAIVSPEFESIKKLSKWIDSSISGDDTKYFSSTFNSSKKSLRVIAACAPQMGMSSTAVVATKLISHFHPKYLALVGITAGVRGKVELGDILVADPSWDWGSGKLKTTDGEYSIDPDPRGERLHPHLRTMFQDIQLNRKLLADIWKAWQGKKTKSPPRLMVGPCASGSSVVACEEIVKGILKHNRKLIGVEMETYGFMHASVHATAPQPQAFSIKSVCDFADKKKNDDFQEYAAFASATALKRIALKYF